MRPAVVMLAFLLLTAIGFSPPYFPPIDPSIIEHPGWLGTELPCEGCPAEGSTIPFIFPSLNPAEKIISVAAGAETADGRGPLEDATIFVMVYDADNANLTQCRIYTDGNGTAELSYDFPVYEEGCERGCTFRFVFCCKNLEEEACLLSDCLGKPIPSYESILPCEGYSDAGWPLIATVEGEEVPLFPTFSELYLPSAPEEEAIPIVEFTVCFPLLVIFSFLGAAMFASGRNPFTGFSFYAPRVSKGPHRAIGARGYTLNTMQVLSFLSLAIDSVAGKRAKKAKGKAGAAKEGKGAMAKEKEDIKAGAGKERSAMLGLEMVNMIKDGFKNAKGKKKGKKAKAFFAGFGKSFKQYAASMGVSLTPIKDAKAGAPTEVTKLPGSTRFRIGAWKVANLLMMASNLPFYAVKMPFGYLASNRMKAAIVDVALSQSAKIGSAFQSGKVVYYVAEEGIVVITLSEAQMGVRDGLMKDRGLDPTNHEHVKQFINEEFAKSDNQNFYKIYGKPGTQTLTQEQFYEQYLAPFQYAKEHYGEIERKEAAYLAGEAEENITKNADANTHAYLMLLEGTDAMGGKDMAHFSDYNNVANFLNDPNNTREQKTNALLAFTSSKNCTDKMIVQLKGDCGFVRDLGGRGGADETMADLRGANAESLTGYLLLSTQMGEHADVLGKTATDLQWKVGTVMRVSKTMASVQEDLSQRDPTENPVFSDITEGLLKAYYLAEAGKVEFQGKSILETIGGKGGDAVALEAAWAGSSEVSPQEANRYERMYQEGGALIKTGTELKKGGAPPEVYEPFMEQGRAEQGLATEALGSLRPEGFSQSLTNLKTALNNQKALQQEYGKAEAPEEKARIKEKMEKNAEFLEQSTANLNSTIDGLSGYHPYARALAYGDLTDEFMAGSGVVKQLNSEKEKGDKLDMKGMENEKNNAQMEHEALLGKTPQELNNAYDQAYGFISFARGLPTTEIPEEVHLAPPGLQQTAIDVISGKASPVAIPSENKEQGAFLMFKELQGGLRGDVEKYGATVGISTALWDQDRGIKSGLSTGMSDPTASINKNTGKPPDIEGALEARTSLLKDDVLEFARKHRKEIEKEEKNFKHFAQYQEKLEKERQALEEGRKKGSEKTAKQIAKDQELFTQRLEKEAKLAAKDAEKAMEKAKKTMEKQGKAKTLEQKQKAAAEAEDTYGDALDKADKATALIELTAQQRQKAKEAKKAYKAEKEAEKKRKEEEKAAKKAAKKKKKKGG